MRERPCAGRLLDRHADALVEVMLARTSWQAGLWYQEATEAWQELLRAVRGPRGRCTCLRCHAHTETIAWLRARRRRIVHGPDGET
jgi:hypothetical protein